MPCMNAEPDLNGRAMARAGAQARNASRVLAGASNPQRNMAIVSAADALIAEMQAILQANAQDMAAFCGTNAFADRLRLDEARLRAMAQGLQAIAALPDPLARVLANWTCPNDMEISRIPQPLGVIGMIYESRPNVGADAAAIALKSGNAILLRGGSESFHSAAAIHTAILTGLRAAGLPETCVQVAPNTDRGFVGAMLRASEFIDLIIPRGGKTLVEYVQHEARVPVLAHAQGLNHVYVHEKADPTMARALVANSKMRRTGVCGAAEVLLIDHAIAPSLLPLLVADLAALGCSFWADDAARTILPELPQAGPRDFDTEWLDAILSIKLVEGLDEALVHIAAHSSEHTDAIITEDAAIAEQFLARVASAVSLWNASTQFCDGGEFGFGGEIGIATGRLHARGPIGPEQLTSFRYVVRGAGQIRA